MTNNDMQNNTPDDQNWNDATPPHDDMDVQPKKSGRGKLLIGVAIVALIAVAGYTYWPFGQKDNATTDIMAAMEASTANSTASTADAMVNQQNPVDAMAMASSTPASTPVAVSMDSAMANAAAPAMASATAVQANIPAMPAPVVASTPAAPVVAMMDNQAAAGTTAVVQKQEEAMNKTAPAPVVDNKMVAVSASTPAPSATSDVVMMDKASASSTAAPVMPAMDVKSEVKADKALDVKPAEVVADKAVTPTTAEAPVMAEEQKAPAVTVEEPKKKIAKPNPWVLRAVSSDVAFVSHKKTPNDLKEVHVGDTLPFIGKVRAIVKEGGVWVVKGSQATIR